MSTLPLVLNNVLEGQAKEFGKKKEIESIQIVEEEVTIYSQMT